MPVKKKEKSLTIESIKKALIPSIANLFENQTVQIDKKFQATEKRLDEKLVSEIRGVKILMEQMDKKIDLALELTETASGNSITLKDHSKRIEKVEGEVRVIKNIIKSSNA